jgi:RecJ-like exonuclease
MNETSPLVCATDEGLKEQRFTERIHELEPRPLKQKPENDGSGLAEIATETNEILRKYTATLHEIARLEHENKSIRQEIARLKETVVCPTCNGRGARLWGHAFDARCKDCDGTGYVSDIKAGQMARMSQ